MVQETPSPAPTVKPRRAAKPKASDGAISCADKILWPTTAEHSAITKQDLVDYHRAAAPWIFPYIQRRPCTVMLATDGITGERFYQRQEGQRIGGLRDAPAVTHAAVPGTDHVVSQFDTVEALVEAAHANVIALHPWNGLPGDTALPGRFVFEPR